MPRKFGFGQIDKQTMKNCALVILVVALIIGIVMVVKDKMSSFGIVSPPPGFSSVTGLKGYYRLSNIYFKNAQAPVGSMLNIVGYFTTNNEDNTTIWEITPYPGYDGTYTINAASNNDLYLKTTYGNGNDNVVHLGGDDNFTTLWDISKIGDNYYISNRYFRGANLKAPYGSFLSSHYGNGYDPKCYVGQPGDATLWDLKETSYFKRYRYSKKLGEKAETGYECESRFAAPNNNYDNTLFCKINISDGLKERSQDNNKIVSSPIYCKNSGDLLTDGTYSCY